ncbi:MAG: glutamate--cysteine ligase, partial [Pseudomonadota bacterium]
MGQEIDNARFQQDDFDRFEERLGSETRLLCDLMHKKAFSDHHPVAGFEIEAWLLYDDMTPAPVNEAYLEKLQDPLASPELAKFNIEL